MAKVNITATNAEIMNTIRDASPERYQTSVPEATDDKASYKSVYAAVTADPLNKNDFITTLFNMIGKVFITNTRQWSNPLKEFKKDGLMFGDTVAEIAVNTFTAKTFTPAVDPSNPATALAQNIPDAKEIFHSINRREVYEATLSDSSLQLAFMSQNGLSNFVQAVMTQLYNSDEKDEFAKMLGIFNTEFAAGNITAIPTPAVTDETSAKELVKKIRATTKRFTFIGSTYNKMEINTFTPYEEIYCFITPEIEAMLDVDVLAYAFNISKAEVMNKIIVVPTLPAGVQALVGDRDMFVVMDSVYTAESIRDPLHLSYNYFLHHWEVMSFSPFVNCVAFTTATPS